ncbi:MAG: S-adenosylmethionine:tRNA ribosyltransferase-isomerase [Firmicutes bacterium]|nr:S-adenosylmethionine:tRNA ribosyltransferase-isomerase [Bacillota bacterium]MCM1400545.1 S-adenosylmethionine:tRNA ribosyltransferase-isomerase [Bacteroides sp.]MCM1476449.1 S-adenosylmethionine:tRNA ribosyltransferase-isomerase [Bacteroides sp.]
MNVTDIKIEDYNYPLPDEKIASHPLEKRDDCKLLMRDADGRLSEHVFSELPQLLPTDSMLVYNNTRVVNARLRFRKPGGARIEIFCLEPVNPCDYQQSFSSTDGCVWTCFVGNSKRWKDGALELAIEVDGKPVVLKALRVSKSDTGSEVAFSWDDSGVTFSKIIEAAGEIPIPPYLNRATEESDATDYQTVYSRIEGSVAAPTAGLHFTPEVLAAIDRVGIERREVTLHVGAGTFQPVKAESIGGHNMHNEFISVPRSLISELASTDRDIIAVGTTSVRTLESLYHLGRMVLEGREPDEVPQWYPYSGPDVSAKKALTALADYLGSHGLDTLSASTRIIIAPGYNYKIVDGMVTNFHQPQSTLLLLVSAFTGGDWRRMYDYALAHDFRFLSYGDAQLLLL